MFKYTTAEIVVTENSRVIYLYLKPSAAARPTSSTLATRQNHGRKAPLVHIAGQHVPAPLRSVVRQSSQSLRSSASPGPCTPGPNKNNGPTPLQPFGRTLAHHDDAEIPCGYMQLPLLPLRVARTRRSRLRSPPKRGMRPVCGKLLNPV